MLIQTVGDKTRPMCENGPMMSASKGSSSMNHLTDTDVTRTKLNLYLHQLAGHTDECVSLVDMEHSYSRPWNWRPENAYAKPVKTLFMNKCQADRLPGEDVDVEVGANNPAVPYDVAKGRALMEECEKQLDILRPNIDGEDGTDVDWEERIDKTNWSPGDLRLFNKVVRILNNDRLARLTYKGNWNEPVMRRLTVDKAARRFRQCMALVEWELDTIHWLHCLLMEHLSSKYLAVYFDILQILKSKIPQLVDRMINVPPSSVGRSGQVVSEALNQLLKRPWDPANLSFSQQRSRKLPGNPLFVMVPYGPGPSFMPNTRPHHWLNYLSGIGTLISVVPPPGSINAKTTIHSCLDQLVASTRSKITELRSDYPGRAIILVGLYSGAALACQVAAVESVTAVVCLGFPLYSVNDRRGQPDDTILEVQVPVLFVVGQNSSLSSVEEMEDMREQMHTVTGLVVVGGADDHLRMSKTKKMREGVTQSMVDLCILDEVAEFLGGILMSPHVPSRQQSSQHSGFSDARRMPVKFFDRKRKAMDANTPHRPAKRGRKPKVLNVQPKPSVATTVENVRWTTVTNGNITTAVPRPAITQVSATSEAAGGISATQVSVASGLGTKSIGSTLTGLRLSPPTANESISEVKLSIQGSVVRQITSTSANSSILPTEGGSITVVAAAPAGPSTSHSITTTTGTKDIVIQVANSSGKSRTLPISSSGHLTALSSLLQQSTPAIVLSPGKPTRDDGGMLQPQAHHVSATVISGGGGGSDPMDHQSNLVEELTPDRILELPVIFEEPQPQSQPEDGMMDLSTVVILGNTNKKQQSFKSTIPSIKYALKNQQQQVKLTKIYLRKKDDNADTSETSVFVEQMDDDQLKASRGSRLRHIPATQHSPYN